MNQKGLVPLLIVILIALAVGGYLIYQKQPKPIPIPTPLPQQTTQPSPTSVSNPAPTGVWINLEPTGYMDTAKWKVFTNSSYSFTFKYPLDWEDFTAMQAVDVPNKALALIQSPIIIPGTEPLRYVMGIYAESINNIKSLRALVAERISLDNSLTTKNLQIGGQEAIPVTGIPSAQGIIEVFVVKDNTLYTFTFVPYDLTRPSWKSKELRDTFSKILSTFKFQ